MLHPFYLWAPNVGRVIGTECATLADATVLLTDRRANGDAFPGERVQEQCECEYCGEYWDLDHECYGTRAERADFERCE